MDYECSKLLFTEKNTHFSKREKEKFDTTTTTTSSTNIDSCFFVNKNNNDNVGDVGVVGVDFLSYNDDDNHNDCNFQLHDDDDEYYYSYIDIPKTKCFIVNKERYYIIDLHLFDRIEYLIYLLIMFISVIDTILSFIALIIIIVVFMYILYILYLTVRIFLRIVTLKEYNEDLLSQREINNHSNNQNEI